MVITGPPGEFKEGASHFMLSELEVRVSADPTPGGGLLRVRDVAERFGVHPSTVREWARTGKLPSRKTPGGQQFRFRSRDVDAFEPPPEQPENESELVRCATT